MHYSVDGHRSQSTLKTWEAQNHSKCDYRVKLGPFHARVTHWDTRTNMDVYGTSMVPSCESQTCQTGRARKREGYERKTRLFFQKVISLFLRSPLSLSFFFSNFKSDQSHPTGLFSKWWWGPPADGSDLSSTFPRTVLDNLTLKRCGTVSIMSFSSIFESTCMNPAFMSHFWWGPPCHDTTIGSAIIIWKQRSKGIGLFPLKSDKSAMCFTSEFRPHNTSLWNGIG